MSRQIKTATGYALHFSDGRVLYVSTGGAEGYAQALALAREEGAEITDHSGDLTDSGDRTLCWATKTDAENDDGRRALCAVRGSYP